MLSSVSNNGNEDKLMIIPKLVLQKKTHGTIGYAPRLNRRMSWWQCLSVLWMNGVYLSRKFWTTIHSLQIWRLEYPFRKNRSANSISDPIRQGSPQNPPVFAFFVCSEQNGNELAVEHSSDIANPSLVYMQNAAERSDRYNEDQFWWDPKLCSDFNP